MNTQWSVLLGTSFDLSPGVDRADLDRIEGSLHVTLPEDVRDLYLWTDGVEDPVAQYHPIWPLGLLVEQTRWQWALGLDRSLIALGDNGCGEPFCVRTAPRSPVYCWYPIGDELRKVTPDLASFVSGCRDGTIRT